MANQQLNVVLRKAVLCLDEFPKQAPSVPTTRYSVPKLATALLENSPDPLALGEELWTELDRRSSGAMWRRFIALLDMQVDNNGV